MNEKKSTPSHHPEKLLHTKLMPPRLHSAIIQRGDLLRRLDEGMTRKLILITAPTGYGKTTLVSFWIADRKIPSAWLTLDPYDNDPVRFWTYVVSALWAIDPTLGRTALPLLTSSQPASIRSFLTALINDLGVLDTNCALVLEDYHTITSEEINNSFSFLLQQLPAALHLVLISRIEPSLPLGILRARDEIVELDTSNLRFTLPETQAFLQKTVNLELSDADMTKLQDRTQGWAAGLRLAARTLQSRSAEETEKFIQSFSGSQRYVADYLIKEVFENQGGAVQSFLLKTCFLDRLTGSLCDAVTGDSNGTEMLEQLGRGDLFLAQLETSGDRIWYRYNPLFAESIQYLVRQRMDPQAVKSIFDKASEWYEDHGLYDQAIEAALAAKLFQRAITLIGKFIEIHELTEMGTVSRWLENIPEELIFQHPEICFTYAQIILFRSSDRFSPATAVRLEPFLSASEIKWQEQANHQKLGEVYSFRGIAAWWQADFQKAFRYARQSLNELPEYDLFWRGNSMLIVSYEALTVGRVWEAQDFVLEARALLGAAQNSYGVLAAIQILSEVFYWQGELNQAELLNRQILKEAVGEESMLDDQGIASLSLAQIAYERNDLDQAEQLATRALDLSRQRGNEVFQVRAAIQQAYIAAARNDYQQADELLKSLVAGIQNPVVLREIQEAQAHIAILAGDVRPLVGWQAIVSGEEASGFNVQKERETFTLARWHIVTGRADEALRILKDRVDDAAANGRVRSQVTARCLEAMAHHAASNKSDALDSLTEALSLGMEKGFRRLLLDEGTGLSKLVQALLSSLPHRSLSLYATALLHSFNAEMVPNQAAPALVEPLSQGELRVLRLLAAGLSNSDIAEELVISTNTVKTHAKSIFRKLNVSSRDEARQVARELKLV